MESIATLDRLFIYILVIGLVITIFYLLNLKYKIFVNIMRRKFLFILLSFLGAFLLSLYVQIDENITRYSYWEKSIVDKLSYEEKSTTTKNEDSFKYKSFLYVSDQNQNLLCHKKFLAKDYEYEYIDILVNSIRVLQWSSIDENCFKTINKIFLDLAYILVIFGWTFTVWTLLYKEISLRIKRKNHSVVIGLNKYSRELIEDLITRKNIVKTYNISNSNEYISELEKSGGIVTSGKLEYTIKDEIVNAKEIFILNETDSESMNNLSLIIDRFKTKKNKELINKTKIYIEIKNRENKVFFDKKGIYNLVGNSYEIIVFSINELIAQGMFKNRPLVSNLEKQKLNYSENLKILIVGFNDLCEEILYNILKLAHFDLKRYVDIKIIDENFENLNIKYKKLINKGKDPWKIGPWGKDPEVFWNIKFLSAIKLYEEETFINDDIFKFNRVILCDKKLNTSMDILNYINNNYYIQLNNKNTIVQVYNEHININKTIDEDDKNTYKNFFTFGDIETIVKYEDITNNKLYEVAKTTNDYKETDEVKKWQNTDSFTRESNITEKLHINVKLEIFNLIICESKDNKQKRKEINIDGIFQEYYNENEKYLKKHLNEAIKLPFVLDNLYELMEFYLIKKDKDYSILNKNCKYLEAELKRLEEEKNKENEIEEKKKKLKDHKAKMKKAFIKCKEKFENNNLEDFYEEVKSRLVFNTEKNKEKNMVIIMAISSVVFYEKIKKNPNHISLINDLAELEHRRWNAYHILNGWKTKESRGKDMMKKEHFNLCNWKTLKKIDHDVVKYDYKNIYQIPFVVHCIGGEIKDNFI